MNKSVGKCRSNCEICDSKIITYYRYKIFIINYFLAWMATIRAINSIKENFNQRTLTIILFISSENLEKYLINLIYCIASLIRMLNPYRLTFFVHVFFEIKYNLFYLCINTVVTFLQLT